MAGNPYLDAQAGAIQNQANNNLFYNQLPSINSGAQAAGGYGGSRQGIAQGLAIGQTNQGVSNALAGLYGNAYENDQNRAVTMRGQDQNYYLGLGGLQNNAYANETGRIGTVGGLQNQAFANDTTRALGFGNLALGNKTADQNYAIGQGQVANAAQANSNSLRLGLGGLENQRYIADQNYTLGQGNLANAQQQTANNYNLGLGQNQNQAQSIANQYALGLGQNQNQALSIANQFTLGNKTADQNYDLGLGNLANQSFANQTSRLGTMGGLDNQRYIADQNYSLGQQNATNQANQIANQYNLGLGNLGYQYAGLDANIYQNNLNNQLQGAQLGLNAYGLLNGYNQNTLNAGNAIQSTPLNYYNQFSNTANGIGQGFATSTNNTSAQGSPLLGALGGAQLGSKLFGSSNLGGIFGGSTAGYDPTIYNFNGGAGLF